MRGLAVMLLSGLVLAGCGRAATAVSPPSESATLTVPSASAAEPAGGNGTPPQITDYPSAPQSLAFFGDLNASITSGRPQSCGYGSGMDNFTIFSYALYFQVGANWYRFGADIDHAGGPYHGPGTYAASGSLAPYGTSGPTYQGRVALTVRSDQVPDSGTVSGELSSGAAGRVNVTGGWTCSPGGQLGPA